MSDVPGAGPIPPPPPKPGASVPERGEAARNRRRLARFAAAVAIAIFLCACIAWVGQYVILYRGQLRIVQDLRDAGVPFTFDEVLESYSMPPDEENGVYAFRDAAAIVDAAWEALSKEKQALLRDAVERTYDGGEIGPEAEALIDAFLEDADAAWSHVAEMRRFPSARFPLDRSNPTWLENFDVRSMMSWSALHSFAIRRALESSAIDRAMETLESEERLASALDGAPSFLGLALRVGAIHSWARSASAILSTDQISVSDLDRIAEASLMEVSPEDFIRSLDSEVVYNLDLDGRRPNAQSAAEELAFLRSAYSQGPLAFLWTRFGSGSRLNIRLVCVDLLLDVREAMDTPYPDRFAQLRALVAESQRGGASRVYARVAFPSSALGVAMVARANAELDALRVAIDIERYRLASGGLPDTLDALVPAYRAEIPIDPFDGQPLRYRRFPEGGYAVYSIGDDFDDDGATPRRTLGEGESDGDIVIRVRR